MAEITRHGEQDFSKAEIEEFEVPTQQTQLAQVQASRTAIK
nr:hypothetical protein [Tanacetum cinerariifolium]